MIFLKNIFRQLLQGWKGIRSIKVLTSPARAPIFFFFLFFSGNRANKSQSESLSIHNSLLLGELDFEKSENPDRSGVLLISAGSHRKLLTSFRLHLHIFFVLHTQTSFPSFGSSINVVQSLFFYLLLFLVSQFYSLVSDLVDLNYVF